MIVETQGNPQQIYPVWAQQQAQLNTELLEVMPIIMVQLFEQHTERQASIGADLGRFGNLIQQFPLGTRWLNLELALKAYELLLQIYTREAFPVQWAATQNNFGNVYLHRIQGEQADSLEEAIKAYELALQIYTPTRFQERWAMTQNNLANAYRNRIRGERADNLEIAIKIYKSVLKIYTREAFPEKWAATQHNLANAYLNRIRGERANNLEEAITAYELAIKVRTREASPTDWAMTQNNLAAAYSNRIRGERADNLEEAIKAYELAVKVRTREEFPEDWAQTQNGLAAAYSNRIRGERADNLEEAIKAYGLAISVRTREAFPEKWAMTQNNLAAAYNNRIYGKRSDNLNEAIKAYELALEIYTRESFPEKWAWTQNNLANAHNNQIREEPADDLKRAIKAYNLALEIFTHNAFPNDCRQTSQNLGNLHFEQDEWQAASDVYSTALAAAETLYQSCILLDGKAAELAATVDLPRRIAYVLARTSDLKKAVETLEQGRARGLTESLDRDRSDLTQLQQINSKLYDRYKDTTNQLRNLEAQQRDRMTSTDRHSITPEVLRETATNLRQQLNNLIQEIRQVPGYETFLTLPTFEDVRKAAKSDRPLVYLTTTSAGSLALIVTPEDTESIWLNDLNEQQLVEILQTWFVAYEQSQTDRQSWLDAIDITTRQLWEPLMQPLLSFLKTHNYTQATLIPTGLLSFLPLHAAWTPDENHPAQRHYALDDIHFTYAPNAKSLTAAQTIAQSIQATTILAIDNPTEDLKLSSSEHEINAAIESFPNPIVLRHTEATVENVRSKLAETSVVHFSCHGTANLNEPLNSGLQMRDGLLTLREILALNLAEKGGIRLAILSACETGLNGVDAIDEAISLPTGLLQAGVAGVIASLWSVSDLSTMLLLTKFYDFWREQHLPPDQALRQAQIWLRDTTNREKLAYFKSNSQNGNRLKIFSENTEFLRNRIMDLERDDRSFAHPFHWAAFYYTGI